MQQYFMLNLTVADQNFLQQVVKLTAKNAQIMTIYIPPRRLQASTLRGHPSDSALAPAPSLHELVDWVVSSGRERFTHL